MASLTSYAFQKYQIFLIAFLNAWHLLSIYNSLSHSWITLHNIDKDICPRYIKILSFKHLSWIKEVPENEVSMKVPSSRRRYLEYIWRASHLPPSVTVTTFHLQTFPLNLRQSPSVTHKYVHSPSPHSNLKLLTHTWYFVTNLKIRLNVSLYVSSTAGSLLEW
jgi:hypothetical protein